MKVNEIVSEGYEEDLAVGQKDRDSREAKALAELPPEILNMSGWWVVKQHLRIAGPFKTSQEAESHTRGVRGEYIDYVSPGNVKNWLDSTQEPKKLSRGRV